MDEQVNLSRKLTGIILHNGVNFSKIEKNFIFEELEMFYVQTFILSSCKDWKKLVSIFSKFKELF